MPPRRPTGGTFRQIILPASIVILLGLGTYGFFELGSFIAREDPLQKADAILVLAGSQINRQLEGADLYLAGYSARLILSQDSGEEALEALAARGVAFATDVERARDTLLQLGIPRDALLVPPRIHTNTAAEAITLRELAVAQGWRRVIVVTSRYHLRRARFAFRRELRGTGVDVLMRGTRYEGMHPDEWFKHRRDIRELVAEVPRLMAYVLGLGA